jgi:hypothetical protein
MNLEKPWDYRIYKRRNIILPLLLIYATSIVISVLTYFARHEGRFSHMTFASISIMLLWLIVSTPLFMPLSMMVIARDVCHSAIVNIVVMAVYWPIVGASIVCLFKTRRMIYILPILIVLLATSINWLDVFMETG